MKKVLFGLAGLLFLSSISTSVAFAASEDVKSIILPLKDGRGQNWVLQNENAQYRLKWSFSPGENQYEHFDAIKLNEKTVLVHSFTGIFAVDVDGQVIWEQKDGSRKLEAGADGSLYTVTNDYAYLEEHKTTSRSTITRFDMKGNLIYRYKDLTLAVVQQQDRLMKNMFYTVDRQGNLITLLDKGLSAIGPDGTMKWQLKELKVKDKSYDVFKMNSLMPDNQGNLLVAIENELICLNGAGEVLWGNSIEPLKSQMILSGNYLVIGNKMYRITKTGLMEAYNPEIDAMLSDSPIDHHGGYYQVDEKTSTLMYNEFQSGQTKWEYTLASSERAAGYFLAENFDQNVVSDEKGNVYVSTNGGTIHSLDNQGNPRFTLQIMNQIMGFSQIIPLSQNTIVITNNQNIICLERINEQPTEISLWLNEIEQSLQHKLIMQNGRVIISLREIFEMLGTKVTWNEENDQIIAERDNKRVVMGIGSQEASINGVITTLDSAPSRIGDVTYVPLRFVSEALGSIVDWDDADKIVRITDPL